jgi:phosphatidylserine decarboxylase
MKTIQLQFITSREENLLSTKLSTWDLIDRWVIFLLSPLTRFLFGWPLYHSGGRFILLNIIFLGISFFYGRHGGRKISFITGILTISLVFCISFFRNPRRENKIRQTHLKTYGVFSPVYGRIIGITRNIRLPERMHEEFGTLTYTRMSIFMSPFDVHVGRCPIFGNVAALRYFSGQFFAAYLADCAEHNEQLSIMFQTLLGMSLFCNFVAGVFARRIVVDPHFPRNNQLFITPQTIVGCIRFGSRADIYIPDTYHFFWNSFKKNQKINAGDVLGYFKN